LQFLQQVTIGLRLRIGFKISQKATADGK